ncbi:hypothetical protein EXS73_01295 [Candidatus Pacearchaeota archaeon]|nr:hypothetical protein [Candidatus Pacearchaeota archaeon]
MAIRNAIPTILGLTVVGAIVGAASCKKSSTPESSQPQSQAQPAIVTHTHTNTYNVPSSLESSVGFHQDHTTQKVNARLFMWEGKPYVVNTNDRPHAGELDFTLQALNNSTLVLNNGTNTALIDSPLYVFVPVNYTANGEPIKGWQFPTNGSDKLSATRTYLNTNLNAKHSGTAQGLKVRMNRTLEIATLNGTPYHVDNDLTKQSEALPATNAVPFALIKTDAQQTYSPEGIMRMQRKGTNAIVYRAVTIPQEKYFARTNQVPTTNPPASTGRGL